MVGEGTVLHIDDVMPENVQEKLSTRDSEKIRKCIVMTDSAMLMEMYEADFKRVLTMKTGSIDQIKSMQIAFIDRILSIAQEQGVVEDASAQKLAFFNEVLLLDKEHELYYWMRGKVLDLTEQINDMRRNRNQKIINMAKSYIEQNFSTGISLEDVAAHVFLSPNYFGWLFNKEVGVNYKDYLTKLRIKKAKNLLQHSHKSIHNIALELGYNDPNYFSQVFWKLEHIRPSSYRQRVRKAVDDISSSSVSEDYE
jgi:two-component system response regulator YesN